MPTLTIPLVSCTPEARDTATDRGRVVFFCRDDSIPAGSAWPASAEPHIACTGALSARVLHTIVAGDRVLITGTAQLIPVDLSYDVAAGRL